MRTETQGPIKHILSWISDQHESARIAQNARPIANEAKIMLAGKIKAYTDIINHIEGRYAGKLDE